MVHRTMSGPCEIIISRYILLTSLLFISSVVWNAIKIKYCILNLGMVIPSLRLIIKKLFYLLISNSPEIFVLMNDF
jgi:hypothetical protein